MIVCGAMLIVHWSQLTKSTDNSTTTLFIPRFSVVEVDPDKCNISKNKLVINADDHLVLVAAVLNTSIEYTNVPFPVNEIVLDEYETYSVLIKWDLSHDVLGDIMYTHGCKMTHTWGDLTNPPPNVDSYYCLDDNPSTQKLAEQHNELAPIFYKKVKLKILS